MGLSVRGMVVIAALIGAGGLGSPAVLGLNTLDIGRAVIGGMGIVLTAIVLDRITHAKKIPPYFEDFAGEPMGRYISAMITAMW